MNELVRKQDAIDAINGYFGFSIEEEYGSAVQEVINGLPSAQSEITHCAECAHWKHSTARESYCEVFDWMSKAEDFCSFAERKGEAE